MRIIPILAAVSALTLAVVPAIFVLAFAFLITELERGINANERPSGLAVVIGVVLLCPLFVLAAGAIAMLRRHELGRVVVAVFAVLGIALIGLVAVAQAIDGEVDAAMQVAVVGFAPGAVLMLATARATKNWTVGTAEN